MKTLMQKMPPGKWERWNFKGKYRTKQLDYRDKLHHQKVLNIGF
jgi:hypothetical protein